VAIIRYDAIRYTTFRLREPKIGLFIVASPELTDTRHGIAKPQYSIIHSHKDLDLKVRFLQKANTFNVGLYLSLKISCNEIKPTPTLHGIGLCSHISTSPNTL